MANGAWGVTVEIAVVGRLLVARRCFGVWLSREGSNCIDKCERACLVGSINTEELIETTWLMLKLKCLLIEPFGPHIEGL